MPAPSAALTLSPELLEACERLQLRIHVVPFESAEAILTEPRLSMHGRPHLLLADRLPRPRMLEEVRRSLADLDAEGRHA